MKTYHNCTLFILTPFPKVQMTLVHCMYDQYRLFQVYCSANILRFAYFSLPLLSAETDQVQR
jgi:hypothetical protein